MGLQQRSLSTENVLSRFSKSSMQANRSGLLQGAKMSGWRSPVLTAIAIKADSHSLITEPPRLGGHEIEVSAGVSFVIPLNNLLSANNAAGIANGGGYSEAT